MRNKRTRRVGLVVELTRAFGRELCEGVVAYAQERDDWDLRFLNVSDLRTPEGREGIDGYIARVSTDDVARTLERTGRPVVDVYYDRVHGSFAIVKTRHEKLGVIAAEHFLDRRFRNFAYCPYGGGRTSRYCRSAFVRRLRRDGFGCSVYGARAEDRYDFDDVDVIGERIAPPSGAKALRRWLVSLPKPVAVFCPGDLRAWQIIRICREAGLNVPREVAVLGLDNDVLICGSARPMLSSIDPNTREIGRVAAETLDLMMERGVPAVPIVRQVSPAGVVARASSETAPVEPPWLADALVYIQRNARHGISASDVFAVLGKSHTVVSRAFRRTLGTTVSREIATARLDEARRLLSSTGHSVTHIAELSGFASVAYFIQSFTSAFGVPPGEWRTRRER